jgi:hypothetical protein
VRKEVVGSLDLGEPERVGHELGEGEALGVRRWRRRG